MKCNLTDHGMGVMLILRGPGGFDGGRVCDAMVTHMDLFPTICQLLDIQLPAWLEGKSLLPLARGETEQLHEEIYGEVTYHAAYEPQRAVRTTRYKYIKRFDPRTSAVLPNCDNSLSRQVWLDAGWRGLPLKQEQLYDLLFDPAEARSLANDPRYAGVMGDMRQRLAAWMQRTHDPLLRGPVPCPPGARINDPDGFSALDPSHTVG
jgi:arylsulfatase A-like enzyme